MVMLSHKGEAVLVSHKTPDLVLMVMLSYKGEAVPVSHKTPALLLMVMLSKILIGARGKKNCIIINKGKNILWTISYWGIIYNIYKKKLMKFLNLL